MLWAAFTIGLFGSLHCIGMCGPIALAIPMQGKSRWHLVSNALLYNVGRAITYGILGLLIGIIGEGIYFAGLQKWLSILTGIGILMALLFSINLEQKIINLPYFNQLFLWLKSSLGKIIKRPSKISILTTGLLNGLLPCGLVYLALASALSLGVIWQSALFMFSFGLGTLPLMLLFILFGISTHQKYRLGLQKLYPIFLTLLAFWFIYRGIHFYLPPGFQISAGFGILPLCHYRRSLFDSK